MRPWQARCTRPFRAVPDRQPSSLAGRTLRSAPIVCAGALLLACTTVKEPPVTVGPAVDHDRPRRSAPHPADGAQEMRALLVRGRELVLHGSPARAIHEDFDPVIARYEQRFAGLGEKIYCANSMQESLLYSASAQNANQVALVLDSTWADAYLYKSYALTELGRLAQSREALERALALSPYHAPYYSELAYTYVREHRWEPALDLYRSAESAAERLASAPSHAQDLGQALRGQAYVLIEQGRLEEASTLYQRCLMLDPHDAQARRELDYLARQRPRGGPRSSAH